MSYSSARVQFICTSLYDRRHKPFHCLHLPQLQKMFAPLLKERQRLHISLVGKPGEKNPQHTIKSGKVEVFTAAHPHKAGEETHKKTPWGLK